MDDGLRNDAGSLAYGPVGLGVMRLADAGVLQLGILLARLD
jgi:hypothetical protein